MCESAMMSKTGDGAAQVSDHIHIWDFGSQHHDRRGEDGLAVEPCAAQACAGKQMRERIQSSVPPRGPAWSAHWELSWCAPAAFPLPRHPLQRATEFGARGFRAMLQEGPRLMPHSPRLLR